MNPTRDPRLQKALDDLRGSGSHERSPHSHSATALHSKPNPRATSPSSILLHQGEATGHSAPDPSTITTWPAALKYVTKHIVPDECIGHKIRGLISQQHSLEREWWAAREAIIAKHRGRQSNQQKAAELLGSLGLSGRAPLNVAPEDDQAELATYDKKVYRESTKMASEADRQLRAMGVPFFAIKHELVQARTSSELVASEAKLTLVELQELQKKMLQTLEDLFVE